MQRASKASVSDSILKASFTEGFDEGRPRDEERCVVEIKVGDHLVWKSETLQSKIGEIIQENIDAHAGERMEITVYPIYVNEESTPEVEDGIIEAEVIEE